MGDLPRPESGILSETLWDASHSNYQKGMNRLNLTNPQNPVVTQSYPTPAISSAVTGTNYKAVVSNGTPNTVSSAVPSNTNKAAHKSAHEKNSRNSVPKSNMSTNDNMKEMSYSQKTESLNSSIVEDKSILSDSGTENNLSANTSRSHNIASNLQVFSSFGINAFPPSSNQLSDDNRYDVNAEGQVTSLENSQHKSKAKSN